MVSIFEEAIAYTTWADNHLCQVVRVLAGADGAALNAPQPLSLPTLQNTLVHTMAAQQAWLLRWTGTSPMRLVDVSDYPDLAGLETEWARVHRELVAFVVGIDPDRLITYKTTRGVEYTLPLGLLVWHVVNHSTEHRAQVAAMATAAGHSPGDIDLLYYLRNKSNLG